MKKSFEKINYMLGSVLLVVVLCQSVSADQIYRNDIKWLSTAIHEVPLKNILSDPRFRNLSQLILRKI